MIIKIPLTLLLSTLSFVLTVGPVFIIMRLSKRSTRNRKSPLNIKLLRSPGHTLQQQITDLDDEIIINLLSIPVLFLVVIAGSFVNTPGTDYRFNLFSFVIVAFIGCAACVWLGVQAYRAFKKRNLLRLGHDCELAVGQSLNDLISHGYKVYHDFPANEFNIDHIAIGPHGVFAVETKGRAKQLDINEPNWQLEFDGVSLKFPTWTEKGPIDQVRRQAKWLSKWIESATGEPQNVSPVLAIPGWFIKRTKPSDIKVFAGKNPEFLTKAQVVLSDKRIAAISHQVEGKCRDVETKSYKKD
ncbi:MAG: nuclease-related domain-containing protein [Desulforhopalus sp.]